MNAFKSPAAVFCDFQGLRMLSCKESTSGSLIDLAYWGLHARSGLVLFTLRSMLKGGQINEDSQLGETIHAALVSCTAQKAESPYSSLKFA